MALNTLKCNHLTPLGLKGLTYSLYLSIAGKLSEEQWRPLIPPYDFLAFVDADEATRQAIRTDDKLAYADEHGIGMYNASLPSILCSAVLCIVGLTSRILLLFLEFFMLDSFSCFYSFC